MKVARWILASLFVMLGLGFAQETPRSETVIFDIDGGNVTAPTNFNWMVPGTARNQGMHQAVWEPLFILNYETGKIMPYLGTEFTSNEGLDVWTLKLRDGVKWSDGEAYNADDIVFTVNMLLNDETASLGGAADMQQWVTSVEKVDDLTVVFNLKAPNPRFQLDYWSVRIWGGIIILPEHIWKDQDPFTFTFYDPEKGWPLGTGAYKLTSASETRFTYERDDNWWGKDANIPELGIDGLPKPKYLVWEVTGSEENKVQLASAGELDSVMDVTLGGFEAMKANNPNMIGWVDGMPYVWFDPCPRQLSFNTAVAPWDDKDLRWAVNYIMNRQEIIDVAYEGTTIPSQTMFVEYGGLLDVIKGITDAGMTLSTTPDVEKGQALIESKGWAMGSSGFYEKDGKTLSIEIQTHAAFIEKQRIAAVLVEQLRSAGIDASTRNVEGATWDDNKQNGNYSAVMDWDACGSINEPWNSMNRFTGQFARPVGERVIGGNNHVRWTGPDNDAYSAIVEKIGVLPLGDPQIVPMVVEAYKYLYDAMPFIPVTQARKLVPFDTTYWTGWPTQVNNYNHPATWWMSTHQIIHNLEPAATQ
jgi:peptide/nickel transport system substrate-binding protein